MKNKNKPKQTKEMRRVQKDHRNRGFSPMQMWQAKKVAKDEVNKMRRDVFATTAGIAVNVLTTEEYLGKDKEKARAFMDEVETLYKNWEDGYVESSDLMEHIQMVLGREAITQWAKMFNTKDYAGDFDRSLSPVKREYADSTLMRKTKADLVEYIRKLENTIASAEKRAEEQSKLLIEYYRTEQYGKEEKENEV